jgi:DNA polymerase III epsilon subunit-like protein
MLESMKYMSADLGQAGAVSIQYLCGRAGIGNVIPHNHSYRWLHEALPSHARYVQLHLLKCTHHAIPLCGMLTAVLFSAQYSSVFGDPSHPLQIRRAGERSDCNKILKLPATPAKVRG